MQFKELQESTKIDVSGEVKVDGVIIPNDIVITTLHGRIWNSSQVVKTKREAVNTSLRATIGQALKMELIDAEEGLALMLVTDKAKIAELRAQMPQTEKSKEPSTEDVAEGKAQFLADKGQRA